MKDDRIDYSTNCPPALLNQYNLLNKRKLSENYEDLLDETYEQRKWSLTDKINEPIKYSADFVQFLNSKGKNLLFSKFEKKKKSEAT